MKFKFTSFVIAASIFASCSVAGTDSQEAEIVGNWKMVKSTSGWSGQTVSPDSVRYPQQLNYTADSTFYHYRADTLVHSGTYSLEKDGEKLRMKYNVQNGDSVLDQLIDFKANDIVKFIYLCGDCGSSTYKRID